MKMFHFGNCQEITLEIAIERHVKQVRKTFQASWNCFGTSNNWTL